jgi:hypothetical protein
MTQKQQFTVVLASVKCIMPMIEGTHDGASKGEHNGETDGVREYGCRSFFSKSFDHSRREASREVKFGVVQRLQRPSDIKLWMAGHAQMEVGKV